ncbi:MAG: 50S ribosomal protein L6 [Patescibacteria group bacterium]|jgi:large subunit ribosomal protein L6
MSRVGNKIITIPDGVTAKIEGSDFSVSGSKGELKHKLPAGITAKIENNQMSVKRSGDSKIQRSLHGTTTRVLTNLVTGVSDGFEKKLDYKGVGFTVVVDDGKMNMRLGFSHPVILEIPNGIEVNVIKNSIVVTGNDKERVGAFAAKIRETKKPEVYKGKGIKYHTEIIKKKAGKTAQSSSS